VSVGDRAVDAVVVGAGIVGAACAYELARAGLRVCVVDRGAVGAATTAACEGNILLSDKVPGPELELARLSAGRWRGLGEELEDDFELEFKGGIVCASGEASLAGLARLASAQAEAGIEVEDVSGDRLWELEPAIDRGLAGAMLYPGDMQVQPMRAAAALLRAARRLGADFLPGTEVSALPRDAGGSVLGVETSGGTIAAAVVVNAAGPWAAELARLADSDLQIAPRRGVILVTEPLPPTVFHKVFAAEYVGDVGSDDASLQVSAVVESTRSGTVLIGASRELVGFSRKVGVEVLRRLAAAAVAVFPVLGGARVIRSYRGYRPFSPDHLPVIGPDPAIRGLWHACGHEGAGIGLSTGTALLLAACIAGTEAPIDASPFDPARFLWEGA
jgi:D-hydroxyproline dehydrogenase subunit beta